MRTKTKIRIVNEEGETIKGEFASKAEAVKHCKGLSDGVYHFVRDVGSVTISTQKVKKVKVA